LLFNKFGFRFGDLGRLDDIDVDITPGVKITVLARKEKKVSIFTKKIFI
jgi:hypothetical protein